MKDLIRQIASLESINISGIAAPGDNGSWFPDVNVQLTSQLQASMRAVVRNEFAVYSADLNYFRAMKNSDLPRVLPISHANSSRNRKALYQLLGEGFWLSCSLGLMARLVVARALPEVVQSNCNALLGHIPYSSRYYRKFLVVVWSWLSERDAKSTIDIGQVLDMRGMSFMMEDNIISSRLSLLPMSKHKTQSDLINCLSFYSDAHCRWSGLLALGVANFLNDLFVPCIDVHDYNGDSSHGNYPQNPYWVPRYVVEVPASVSHSRLMDPTYDHPRDINIEVLRNQTGAPICISVVTSYILGVADAKYRRDLECLGLQCKCRPDISFIHTTLYHPMNKDRSAWPLSSTRAYDGFPALWPFLSAMDHQLHEGQYDIDTVQPFRIVWALGNRREVKHEHMCCYAYDCWPCREENFVPVPLYSRLQGADRVAANLLRPLDETENYISWLDFVTSTATLAWQYYPIAPNSETVHNAWAISMN